MRGTADIGPVRRCNDGGRIAADLITKVHERLNNSGIEVRDGFFRIPEATSYSYHDHSLKSLVSEYILCVARETQVKFFFLSGGTDAKSVNNLAIKLSPFAPLQSSYGRDREIYPKALALYFIYCILDQKQICFTHLRQLGCQDYPDWYNDKKRMGEFFTSIVTLMVAYSDPKLRDDTRFNYRHLLSKTNLIRMYFMCLMNTFLSPVSFKAGFDLGYLDTNFHEKDKQSVEILIKSCRQFLEYCFLGTITSELKRQGMREQKTHGIELLREFFAPYANTKYSGKTPDKDLLISDHVTYFETVCDQSFPTLVANVLVKYNKLHFVKSTDDSKLTPSRMVAHMMGFRDTRKVKSKGSVKSVDQQLIKDISSAVIRTEIKKTTSFGETYAEYLFDKTYRHTNLPMNTTSSNAQAIFCYILRTLKACMNQQPTRIVFSMDLILNNGPEYVNGMKKYIKTKGRTELMNSSTGELQMGCLEFFMGYISENKYRSCKGAFENACEDVLNG